MRENELNSLSPADFMNIVPEREKHFAMADASLKSDIWCANKLSARLHPGMQRMVISQVIRHSDDCRSYILKMEEEGRMPAYFSAGQYICVKLDINGKYISRPYSISSSPEDAAKGFYRISVKKCEGGLATEYIYSNWQEGSLVEVSEPMGLLTYEPLRDAKHIVAVAGGMGITPFLSMAKAVMEGTEQMQLTILYGAPDENSAVFHGELDEICAKTNDVAVKYVYGNITVDDIISAAKTRSAGEKSSVFVCGPRGLYQFVEENAVTILNALDIDASMRYKYVRFESFGEMPVMNNALATTVNITVRINGNRVCFTARTDATILRALEENGVPAVSGCRSGRCGYCRSKLISGEVFIPDKTDGRRLADRKYSYIHPCCTYPLTDIELEVPSAK